MKKLILFSTLLTALLWQGTSLAQCSAPLTITPTGSNGEVDMEYDLGGVANPGAFYGEISIYNVTTSTSYPNVYITQGNNPYAYQFVENGTYDIWSLTMDSLTSCIDTIQYTYVVSGIPNTSCDANFDIVNDSTQTITYIGYNYSTGTNLTYFWDFGDGGTSTDQFPTHTFANVGTFDVCLTVDDGNGCTDMMCETIIVFTKASQTTINIYDPQTAGLHTAEKFTEVSVYPNPSNGEFNISFNANEANETVISIMDINGRVIANEFIQSTTGQNQVNIDLQDAAPGIYFWQINNDTNGKLVIR